MELSRILASWHVPNVLGTELPPLELPELPLPLELPLPFEPLAYTGATRKVNKTNE
tara:strand:- start:107 stop:274 length:168 start_codon:yes stop_codon:yes gene_type:complete